MLVVSEELDELFEICDRIAVIAQGRLSPAQADARDQRRGDRPADERRGRGAATRRRQGGRRCASARGSGPSRRALMRLAVAAARGALTLVVGARPVRRSRQESGSTRSTLLHRAVATPTASRELLLKATPLMLIAVGLAVGYPRQCLEHRRRRPADHRRDRRRRRRALLPELEAASGCCR